MKSRLCLMVLALALALPMLFVAGGVSAAPAGSSNEALARPSLRHPVQNEQFYFVMPDRFENGDDANARRETSP